MFSFSLMALSFIVKSRERFGLESFKLLIGGVSSRGFRGRLLFVFFGFRDILFIRQCQVGGGSGRCFMFFRLLLLQGGLPFLICLISLFVAAFHFKKAHGVLKMFGLAGQFLGGGGDLFGRGSVLLNDLVELLDCPV